MRPVGVAEHERRGPHTPAVAALRLDAQFVMNARRVLLGDLARGTFEGLFL